MAVTAGGTPYVESSDLVANYPGASLALANRVDQVMQAPTQNAITSTTYTAALLDAGKTVTLSNASAVTLTIPAQATVAWVANTQLNFLNIGAGTVTITPAATVTINGTPLTLNTSQGGSLVRTQSNTWTFRPSGASGKILQVVEGSTATQVSINTTSLTDTGLTATITPTSITSKILVLVVQAGTVRYNGSTQQGMNINLYRDATKIADTLRYGGYTSTDTYMFFGTSPAMILDSPATVSAVTYKTQFYGNDTTTLICQYSSTRSSIVLMEVAA